MISRATHNSVEFATRIARHSRLLTNFGKAMRPSSTFEFQKARKFEALLKSHEVEVGRWRQVQQSCADDFNLLDVFNLAFDEVRHSMLLAWLLDSDIRNFGTHAQGSLGFKIFLEVLIESSVLPRTAACYSEFRYVVRREAKGSQSRMDVRVEAKGDFIIDIENKILSEEGYEQTFREWEDLLARAKQLNVPLNRVHGFFLTPDGRKAQNECFKPVSYAHLARALEKFAASVQPRDVQLFAAHCATALRKNIVAEQTNLTKESNEDMV